MVAGVAVGLAAGLANGVIVTFFRINALIATLAMSFVVSGFASLITGGNLLVVSQPEFQALARTDIIGVRSSTWIMVVAVVLFGAATVPVFSAIAAYLLGGEATGRATWITISIVLIGIGIAVFSEGSDGVGLNLASLIGASAGLEVAMVFAISFVTLRMHRSLAILPTLGVGALVTGSFGLVITGPGAVFEGKVWAIAISGALLLPVSFFAISLATGHTHPSNVSLLLLLEMVLGPAWVWYGIGERPTPQMIFGGAVVVLSLTAYLLNARRQTVARQVR